MTVDPDLCRHMASLGPYERIYTGRLKFTSHCQGIFVIASEMASYILTFFSTNHLHAMILRLDVLVGLGITGARFTNGLSAHNPNLAK